MNNPVDYLTVLLMLTCLISLIAFTGSQHTSFISILVSITVKRFTENYYILSVQHFFCQLFKNSIIQTFHNQSLCQIRLTINNISPLVTYSNTVNTVILTK